MTTPRIEENNDYIKMFLDEGTRLFGADLSIMVGTVAKIRNQAHQAGIDEAVEVINSMSSHYGDSGFGCFIDKDDTIKALQDNK